MTLFLRAALAAAVLLPVAARADQTAPAEPAPSSAEQEADRQPVLLLPPVEVRGIAIDEDAGRMQLLREDVERLQDGNGDLNRLLRALPNVQFEEAAGDARKLGEIVPARISISGSRYYDNRFDVDGISTNSVLDPAGGTRSNAVTDTPGFAQSQFFDTELIDSLEVFDSNAPARYGGFTGGIVSARTRAPEGHRRFSAFFSGTSDELVNFHVIEPPADPANPDGITITDQPQFRKSRYGFNYDQPLGRDTALLLSATRIESTIPSLHFDGFRSEQRSNTNVLAKAVTRVRDLDVTLSANYTPYASDQFLVNVQGSDYTVTGGGYAAATQLQGDTRWGALTAEFSYAASDNSRNAPKDYFNWLTSSNGPDWGESIYSLNSREGGYGDIDKQQNNLRSVLSLARAHWGGTLETGIELERVGAAYRRRVDTYLYSSGTIDSRVRCVGVDVPACISGNQALFTRNVYPTDDVDAALIQAGLYAEWQRDWERWSLRLGLRADGDDFQNNLNIAPRSLLTYRPWTDVAFHLGANRYYSRSLLTYKLREARAPYYTEYRQARAGMVGGLPVLLVEDIWQRTAAAGNIVYSGSVSDLKTPYSDELAGGLSFALLGGTAGLRGVLRRYRDEFSQSESPEDPVTGLITRTPANAGRSEYESLTLAWARRIWRVDLGVNLTWSETRRSNPEYDSRAAAELDDELVYYRNEVMPRGKLDLLAEDFARPLVANVSLASQLTPRFDVSLTGRWRERYENLRDSGQRRRAVLQQCPGCPATEQELAVYEQTARPATVLFDAKLRYRLPLSDAQALDFEVLVDNLFDARTHTATGVHAYEAGVGFWGVLRYCYGGP